MSNKYFNLSLWLSLDQRLTNVPILFIDVNDIGLTFVLWNESLEELLSRNWSM